MNHDTSMHRFGHGFWTATAASALAVFVAGCEASDAATVQPGQAALVDEHATARAALRARIDFARSAIALEADERAFPQQRALDVDGFAQTLAAVTGTQLEAQLLSGTMTYLKLGDKTVSLEPSLRYVSVHDARGYTYEQASALTDSELETTSEDLLASMGIDKAEAASEVVALGAESAAPSGEGTEVSRMGQKVFYFRRIAGIPVAGNRMVFSYGMDGTLRHIRGTWPAVELARSITRSTLSVDEVVDRAVDAMLAAGAATDASNPIRLETFFEWDEQEVQALGTASLRLRGAAITQATGPEGRPGRGVRYEFDI